MTDTITPLTHQEMFDKALFGIRKQGYEQSLSGNKAQCAYVGPEGKHCAVGHCLDEKTLGKLGNTTELNTLPVIRLMTSFPDLAVLLGSQTNYQFLVDLQQCHDSMESRAIIGKVSSPIAFEKYMYKLAKDQRLKFTPAVEVWDPENETVD